MKTVTFNLEITLSNKNWIDDTTTTKLADQLAVTIKKVAQPSKVVVTWRRDDEKTQDCFVCVKRHWVDGAKNIVRHWIQYCWIVDAERTKSTSVLQS